MTMPGFVTHYAYLTCCVVYSVVIVVVTRATLSRGLFNLTMLSGLISVPAFVFGVYLEGSYWHPVRLGGLPFGVEDVLVSFAISAMAWYAAAILFRRHLVFRFDFRRSLKRWIVGSVCAAGTFVLVVQFCVDGMTSLLLTYGLLIPVLLAMRRGIWPLAAAGVPLFALLWFGVVKITLGVFPDAVLNWNLAGVWGATWAGVPCGEIIWAAFYGAYWPLFTAFVYELEWKRVEGRTPS